MPNKERLLELADRIESTQHLKKGVMTWKVPPEEEEIRPMNGFNMQEPYPVYWMEGRCGCIMAHAADLFGLPIPQVADEKDLSVRAAEYLGLDWYEGDQLFYPRTGGENWDSITPERAAQALREVAEGCSPYDVWGGTYEQ